MNRVAVAVLLGDDPEAAEAGHQRRDPVALLDAQFAARRAR